MVSGTNTCLPQPLILGTCSPSQPTYPTSTSSQPKKTTQPQHVPFTLSLTVRLWTVTFVLYRKGYFSNPPFFGTPPQSASLPHPRRCWRKGKLRRSAWHANLGVESYLPCWQVRWQSGGGIHLFFFDVFLQCENFENWYSYAQWNMFKWYMQQQNLHMCEQCGARDPWWKHQDSYNGITCSELKRKFIVETRASISSSHSCNWSMEALDTFPQSKDINGSSIGWYPMSISLNHIVNPGWQFGYKIKCTT